MTVSPSSRQRHEKLMRHAASARGDLAPNSGKATRRRPAFIILLAACVFMLVVGVTLRHRRSNAEPASIVQERISIMVLEGAWMGGLFIKAERIDRLDGALINFRATAENVLLTADRALPLVNAEDASLSFDLSNVILVGASESSDGTFRTLESHRLGPFPLSIRVKADPPQLDATDLLREFAEVPTELPFR